MDRLELLKESLAHFPATALEKEEDFTNEVDPEKVVVALRVDPVEKSVYRIEAEVEPNAGIVAEILNDNHLETTRNGLVQIEIDEE